MWGPFELLEKAVVSNLVDIEISFRNKTPVFVVAVLAVTLGVQDDLRCGNSCDSHSLLVTNLLIHGPKW